MRVVGAVLSLAVAAAAVVAVGPANVSAQTTAFGTVSTATSNASALVATASFTPPEGFDHLVGRWAEGTTAPAAPDAGEPMTATVTDAGQAEASAAGTFNEYAPYAVALFAVDAAANVLASTTAVRPAYTLSDTVPGVGTAGYLRYDATAAPIAITYQTGPVVVRWTEGSTPPATPADGNPAAELTDAGGTRHVFDPTGASTYAVSVFSFGPVGSYSYSRRSLTVPAGTRSTGLIAGLRGPSRVVLNSLFSLTGWTQSSSSASRVPYARVLLFSRSGAGYPWQQVGVGQGDASGNVVLTTRATRTAEYHFALAPPVVGTSGIFWRSNLVKVEAQAANVPTVLYVRAPSHVDYSYGGGVRVLLRTTTGRAAAYEYVDVYGRRRGTTTWARLGRVRTDAYGNAHLTYAPKVNTEYTARHPRSTWHQASASGIAVTFVRPVVRVTHQIVNSTKLYLYAKVLPSHAGQIVWLQQSFNGGAWRTVRTVTLSSSSTATVVWTTKVAGRYAFQFVKPADADHVTGSSDSLSFIAR